MLKTSLVLRALRIIVALNLLYGAFYKFAGYPFSVALFTHMSLAAGGLVPEPAFRLAAATFELVGAALFLIPRTAKIGAASSLATWSAPC